MKVVIVGERLRSEASDMELVHKLLDGLMEQYPNLFIVTTGTDRGVGKVVKNRLAGSDIFKPLVNFCDVQLKIYTKTDLPRAEYAQLYLTRNYMLLEAGEEFHLFMDQEKGYMWHLLLMVQKAGLPHSVYAPGEVGEPKLLK